MTEVYVAQDILQAGGELDVVNLKGTKRGELCIMDFWTEMAIDGHAYQIRAGTISAAIGADATAITDAAAEIAVTARNSAMTFLPAEAWITLATEATDSVEVAIKSIGTAHTAGTGAFVPLNLLVGGVPSQLYADAKTTGGVVVGAELATDTRQHFHVTKEYAKDSALEWQGKNMMRPWYGGDLGHRVNPIIWRPVVPPVLKGTACCYIQVAGATACTYFGHMDWVELPTAMVS